MCARPTFMVSYVISQQINCFYLQTKEVSSVPNTAQRVPSEISPENSDESNLSQSSNMNPLFARARAAVKNASFGDNEGKFRYSAVEIDFLSSEEEFEIA